VVQLNNHSDNNSKYGQCEIKWGNINATNIGVDAHYISAITKPFYGILETLRPENIQGNSREK
jgi:hypothetical protein